MQKPMFSQGAVGDHKYGKTKIKRPGCSSTRWALCIIVVAACLCAGLWQTLSVGGPGMEGSLARHVLIPPENALPADAVANKNPAQHLTRGVTYVTALYNIRRGEEGDGRSFDQYLSWFKTTLQLNAPMVVFVPEGLRSFVLEHRPEPLRSHTLVIGQELENVPYYKYKGRIHEILHDERYQSRMGDPNRVECRMDLYNIIQYSKFEWIRRAVRENPFSTTHFFWTDAGMGRFYPGENELLQRPANMTLSDDRFMMAATDSIRPEAMGHDYIWSSHSRTYGGVFGGPGAVMIELADLVSKTFEDYLDEGAVNNEQILLGILLYQQPTLFEVYWRIQHDRNGHQFTILQRLLHQEQLRHEIWRPE